MISEDTARTLLIFVAVAQVGAILAKIMGWTPDTNWFQVFWPLGLVVLVIVAAFFLFSLGNLINRK